MSREILEAMHALAREKGISSEKLMGALEDALLSAYKKQPGSAKYARVEMDRETGDYRVIELIIPERLEAHLIVETIDEGTVYDPETGEMVEPQDPEIDPAKFEEYKDQIDERDVTPEDFGRIAAQTAKQVILQRIREAERDMMFEEYRDRVGELITGIVQQSDSRYTLVQLRERVEALLPKSEQVEGERYDHSQRVKAVIKEVSPSTKGPSIIVSRRDPELIKKLFELEVPEIADGLVEIANVAREPGYRSKIAVISHADGVDPVGACVGPRGSRVRMVVSELRGEKIDIIPYNDEPARFVAKALSPARVREVLVDDDGKQATVIVPDDQLSLAIGREGQNARLAARLTGWRIDIKSETDFATRGAGVRLRGGGDLRPLRRDPRQRPALPERRRCRARATAASRATRRSRATGSDHVGGPPAEAEPDVDAEPVVEAGGAPELEPAPEAAEPGTDGGAVGRPRSTREVDAVEPQASPADAPGRGGRGAARRSARAAEALHRLRCDPRQARADPSCRAGDRVVADPRAALPGRGAYVCSAALRRRGAAPQCPRRAPSAARCPPTPTSYNHCADGQEARTRDRQGAGSVQQGRLAKLQAAGHEVKAAASSIDEAVALQVLGRSARQRRRASGGGAVVAPPALEAGRRGSEGRHGRARLPRSSLRRRRRAASAPSRPCARAAGPARRTAAARHRPADPVGARAARAPQARGADAGRSREGRRDASPAPDARRARRRAGARRRRRPPPRRHRLPGLAPRARRRARRPDAAAAAAPAPWRAAGAAPTTRRSASSTSPPRARRTWSASTRARPSRTSPSTWASRSPTSSRSS